MLSYTNGIPYAVFIPNYKDRKYRSSKLLGKSTGPWGEEKIRFMKRTGIPTLSPSLSDKNPRIWFFFMERAAAIIS